MEERSRSAPQGRLVYGVNLQQLSLTNSINHPSEKSIGCIMAHTSQRFISTFLFSLLLFLCLHTQTQTDRSLGPFHFYFSSLLRLRQLLPLIVMFQTILKWLEPVVWTRRPLCARYRYFLICICVRAPVQIKAPWKLKLLIVSLYQRRARGSKLWEGIMNKLFAGPNGEITWRLLKLQPGSRI